MKTAVWIVGVIALLGLSWLGLILMSSDVVESDYASLQEAHADQLFERGWLPDILPPSAHDIRTSNNLDLNTSVGGFYFASADYDQFASHLAPYVSMEAPFDRFEQKVQRKRARGFAPGVFVDENSVWVFMCKAREGYCEYDMWLKNG
jgi:hypothetical protein